MRARACAQSHLKRICCMRRTHTNAVVCGEPFISLKCAGPAFSLAKRLAQTSFTKNSNSPHRAAQLLVYAFQSDESKPRAVVAAARHAHRQYYLYLGCAPLIRITRNISIYIIWNFGITTPPTPPPPAPPSICPHVRGPRNMCALRTVARCTAAAVRCVLHI